MPCGHGAAHRSGSSSCERQRSMCARVDVAGRRGLAALVSYVRATAAGRSRRRDRHQDRAGRPRCPIWPSHWPRWSSSARSGTCSGRFDRNHEHRVVGAPHAALDTSRPGCDPQRSLSLRTPAAPSEKSRDGVGDAHGGHRRISARPAATEIGARPAPAVTRTAAWLSTSNANGVRPEPHGVRGGFSASERDDVGRGRLCTLVQARSDSLLRAPGPTRHTPVGPGYVPPQATPRAWRRDGRTPQ
jgi:hypothetical protein